MVAAAHDGRDINAKQQPIAYWPANILGGLFGFLTSAIALRGDVAERAGRACRRGSVIRVARGRPSKQPANRLPANIGITH